MSSSYFKTANYSSAAQGTVANLTDKAFHGLKELITSRAFPPIVLLARTTIIGLMEKLVRGQLRVVTKEGVYTFGTPKIYSKQFPNLRKDGDEEEELRAEIVVVNDAFWVRMLLLSDLGFSEAYMIGDIEVDNLDALFKLFILNRSSLNELSTGTAGKIFSALTSLASARFVNSLSNAISNISAHYDISNHMFEAFLSADMTYSCAIFGEKEGGPEGDLLPLTSAPQLLIAAAKKEGVDLLEQAQMRKLRRIIEKAKLSKGDRVLEIGSGWGSLAIEAVRSTGCTIDTLTLSIEQKHLAEARIAAAGLTSSITVHLMDYRSVPASFLGAFDRVISIEMIEAVGQEFLDTYFGVVESCLNERGIAVVQVITMPEARFASYASSTDFIQKYIFPGGFLPSVNCLCSSIVRGGKERLTIESIENIGPHYARTLRDWRSRFEATFETDIVPALRTAYPELEGRKGVEVFRRKWIYYFQYCATGFAMRALGDHILTLTREGNLSLH